MPVSETDNTIGKDGYCRQGRDPEKIIQEKDVVGPGCFMLEEVVRKGSFEEGLVSRVCNEKTRQAGQDLRAETSGLRELQVQRP